MSDRCVVCGDEFTEHAVREPARDGGFAHVYGSPHCSRPPRPSAHAPLGAPAADAERMLASVREFACSLSAVATAATAAMAVMDKRVAALEQLVDPVPSDLDPRRVALERRVDAFEERLLALENGAKPMRLLLNRHETHLCSLETRLEAVIVKLANQED